MMFQAQQDNITNIRDLLKAKYRQHLHIGRVLGGDPLSLSECYINLALMKEVIERKEKPGQDDERLSSFEEIHAVKEPLPLEQLFTKQKDENKDPQKILILGRAGIGKSTLCQKIAIEWTEGRLWQNKIVVLIRLRDLLNIEGELNPADIVRRFCLIKSFTSGDLTTEMIAQFLTANEHNCLWILDGYDEIIQQTDDPALQYRWKAFFETIWHSKGQAIVTSRPNAIGNQLAGLYAQFDRCLENMGFTNENIEVYVNKFVAPSEKATELLKLLHNDPNLWGVSHIPINLDLICSVEPRQLGQNITALYQQLTQCLFDRYVANARRTKQEVDMPNVVHSLCTLAYKALCDEQIIITEAALKTYLQGCPTTIHELLKTGLIRSTVDKAVYFIHLTFQEFSAATYIAEQIIENFESDVLAFIQNEKYNPRYQIVFLFVVGRLYQYWQVTNDEFPLLRFFNSIQRFPRDLLGIQHAALLIRLLDACEANEKLISYGALMQEVVPWVKLWIENKAVDSSPILSTLSVTPRMVNATMLISLFIDKLRNGLHDVVSAAKALGKLGISGPEIISGLLDALCDESRSGRCVAAEALGKLGISSPEVITALLNALRDKDEYVPGNAAKALGKLGISGPEIISGLLNALHDKNPLVRRSVVDALGKIGISSPEVTDGLLGALRDSCVREKAALVLGKMEVSLSSKVIAVLLDDLRDECYDVEAAEALGKLGISSPDVIAGLLDALSNENVHVRWSAAEALVNLGTSKEAINALLNTLHDENKYLRGRSAKALGVLGNELGVSDPKVITALLDALRDEDSSVRREAAEALANQGVSNPEIIAALLHALYDKESRNRWEITIALGKQNVSDPEVITGLLNALPLHDEDGCVRGHAAEALAFLGVSNPEVITALLDALHDKQQHVGDMEAGVQITKALVKLGISNPKVITALLDALYDEDPSVRSKAAYALGKMGISSPEVTTGLLSALRDKDLWVYKSVVEALVDLGISSPEVITALLNDLHHKYSEIRKEAPSALVKLEVFSPEVITALLNALRDKDEYVRMCTVEALSMIKISYLLNTTGISITQIQELQKLMIDLNLPINALRDYLSHLEIRQQQQTFSFITKYRQATYITNNNWQLVCCKDLKDNYYWIIEGITDNKRICKLIRTDLTRCWQITDSTATLLNLLLADSKIQTWPISRQSATHYLEIIERQIRRKVVIDNPQAIFDGLTQQIPKYERPAYRKWHFYTTHKTLTESENNGQSFNIPGCEIISYQRGSMQGVKLQLDLQHPECQKDRYIVLQKVLQQYCFDIKELDLSNNQLDDLVMPILSKILSQFTQLQILRLSHNEITEEALYQILQQIAQYPYLKQLLLDYNYISFNDDGAQRVRGLLEKTGLINLDLSMNFIHKGAVITEIRRKAKGEEYKIIIVYNKQSLAHRTQNRHRICKDLFAQQERLNSLFLQPVTSCLSTLHGGHDISPQEKIIIDLSMGAVGLFAYKAGKTSSIGSIMGAGEHAFLALEGIHSFGQRYLIMGDLKAIRQKVLIDICYVTPKEFYNRTKDLTATYKKCAQVKREQLKLLVEEMIKSRNSQDFFRYSLTPRPQNNEYSCISWAKEILVRATIMDSAELHSWFPSHDVGDKSCLIM